MSLIAQGTLRMNSLGAMVTMYKPSPSCGGTQNPLLPGGDLLSDGLTAIQEVNTLLSLLEDVGTALAEVSLRLELLTEHARKFASDTSDDGGSVEDTMLCQMVAQLGCFASRLQQAKPHLEGMQQLVQQGRYRNACAQRAFAAREQVWAQKLACDEQVSALLQRSPKHGPQTLDEKRMRLVAQDEAGKSLQRCTEHAERAAESVLEHRIHGTAAVLEKLCEYLFAAVDPTSTSKHEVSSEAVSRAVSMASCQSGLHEEAEKHCPRISSPTHQLVRASGR